MFLQELQTSSDPIKLFKIVGADWFEITCRNIPNVTVLPTNYKLYFNFKIKSTFMIGGTPSRWLVSQVKDK